MITFITRSLRNLSLYSRPLTVVGLMIILQLLVLPKAMVEAAPVGGTFWEQIGPSPLKSGSLPSGAYSGRIRSIAVQDTSTIYVGAASGGVWKTTNGGSSWTPLTDDQPSLNMGSIAIDPWNSAFIYAGTGEYSGKGPNFSTSYGAGLLKSTDSGSTWTHLPGPWYSAGTGGAEIQKVVVLPGPGLSNPNDDIVIVAANTGLFRSIQGGSDWQSGNNTNLNPVVSGNFSDVVVNPNSFNILYAVRKGYGIYRSSDWGGTWVTIWTPASPCSVGRGALALAPTNTNILYAVFHTPSQTCGTGTNTGAIFRTTNARASSPTFNTLNTPSGLCGQCDYDLALIVQEIDPDGPGGPLDPQDIVYAGGLNTYRSTDGGTTWNKIQGTSGTWIHSDIHTFAFDSAGNLYVGDDGGISRLPNPATAAEPDPGWVSLNTNLTTIQFFAGVSLHSNSVQSGKPLILGGAQDNGTGKYTGNIQWDKIKGGDGGYTAVDFTDPDKTFYVSETGTGLRIFKTTDGGPNINQVFTGSGGLTIASPFVMCPDSSQVIIIGNDVGVWRTDTGFASTSDNSPAFGTQWHHSPSALAFAPGTSCNTYFAGGYRGDINPPQNYIKRTTTGGGTAANDWQDITGNLPNRPPSDFAVHPTNPNIVYVTLALFCGNNTSCPINEGHVWMTTNALAVDPATVTWTDLTGGKNMPNVPVNAIVMDQADTQRLYIGTDLGVYRSTDGGTTWEAFQNGLPNVMVTDLVLNNTTGVLVAVTYGRSMYHLSGAVYVDGSWTGYEDGSVQFPFNTISEGVNAVPSNGELWIKAGTYTGTGNVPITINKPFEMNNYGGAVIIGSP